MSSIDLNSDIFDYILSTKETIQRFVCKYIFMLKPKQLFIIIYVNVFVKSVSRGMDALVKIQIFRMVNCLLLLTAQLITACDLNA
jgi:hypothetical protein